MSKEPVFQNKKENNSTLSINDVKNNAAGSHTDNRLQSVAQKKQVEALANKATGSPIQKKSNTTHLPDNLKSGIENISAGTNIVQLVKKDELTVAQWAKVNSPAFIQFAIEHKYALSSVKYPAWLNKRGVDTIRREITEFDRLNVDAAPAAAVAYAAVAAPVEDQVHHEEAPLAAGHAPLPAAVHHEEAPPALHAPPAEAHIATIAGASVGAFAHADPRTYEDARARFTESAGLHHAVLSSAAAIAAGFSGIIHFGTNKSRPNTNAGIAAKPHAIKHYGGTELSWANIQEISPEIRNNEQIKASVAHVRPGVNNANVSAMRLEVALRNHELIYFHLNQFSQPMIAALVANNAAFAVGAFKPVLSVTGQEFIHIHRNWARFQHSVVFLRNLAPVNRPW